MKPNFMQWNQVLNLAVQQINKFCVYVNNGLDYNTQDDEDIWLFLQEQIKLKYPENCWDYLTGLVGGGLFVFNTENEAWQFYEVFESGPIYASAIYAQIIAPNGDAMTENT